MKLAQALLASFLAVRPSTILELLGRKILPALKAQVKYWRFFPLKNKVNLVKIDLGVKISKIFRLRLSTFLYSIF